MIHAFDRFLQVVKAGQAGKVVPTSYIEVDSVRLATLSEEEKNKSLLFSVIGESLAPEGIHTGFILIATKSGPDFSFSQLEKGDFIILKISDNMENTKEANLKIRKYLTTIDLNAPLEELWDKACSEDDLSIEEGKKDLFKRKYEKALSCISANERKNVLLSITYTSENGREYSFHPNKKFYAKVNAYIDNDNKMVEL